MLEMSPSHSERNDFHRARAVLDLRVRRLEANSRVGPLSVRGALNDSRPSALSSHPRPAVPSSSVPFSSSVELSVNVSQQDGTLARGASAMPSMGMSCARPPKRVPRSTLTGDGEL
jgi:hypothetical protein